MFYIGLKILNVLCLRLYLIFVEYVFCSIKLNIVYGREMKGFNFVFIVLF